MDKVLAAPQNIVVIEDDPDMLRLIETVLQADGYITWAARNGTEGAAKALDPAIDLIIIDLGLPDTDGLQITRMLRANTDASILILTGRSDVASRVEGLDAGADDYLLKPFNLDEFRARVRSALRRVSLNIAAGATGKTVVTESGWRLEVSENVLVADDDRRVRLTERESWILSILIGRAESVVSRDDLQGQISGRKWHSEDRSLDVHISHLRKKFRKIDAQSCSIKTIRGRGFMFAGSAQLV